VRQMVGNGSSNGSAPDNQRFDMCLHLITSLNGVNAPMRQGRFDRRHSADLTPIKTDFSVLFGIRQISFS